MKKLHILLYVFLAIVLSAQALALSCSYSPAPTYNPANLIYWECITNENTTCYSYVKYGSTIIQANPYPSFNKDQDEVREGFLCNDICTVSFSQEDLRTDRNVTFGVYCGADNYEVENIVPELKIFTEEVIEKTSYLKDNASYIILLLFLIIISVVGAGLVYKLIKGEL